jgi:hypothetical protein
MRPSPKRPLIVPASEDCELLQKATLEKLKSILLGAARHNQESYGIVRPAPSEDLHLQESVTRTFDGRPVIIVVPNFGSFIMFEREEYRKVKRAWLTIMDWIDYHNDLDPIYGLSSKKYERSVEVIS